MSNRVEPAHDSPILAAAVLTEAAAIAAGAQAVVAAEVQTMASPRDTGAVQASIRASRRARGAAAAAFAAAQAATAETTAALAAVAAAEAAALVAPATDAVAAAAAVAATAAAAELAAEHGLAAVATAVATAEAALGADPKPPEAGPVGRLTDLVAGLDEAVRAEWDDYLSAPVAPLSLPGIPAGAAAPAGLYGLVRDLTLARRIELALAQSGEMLQSTFDHAPLAMLQASFDGSHMLRFLRVNPAMCRLSGYTEEELLALDPRALLHPGDVSGAARGYRGGPGGSLVLRWMHADGHSIDVRLHLAVVGDARGPGEYVIGQVEDVTGQQRVGAVLRQSEELFRIAFEQAPTATLLIRLTGSQPAGLLKANRAACRLTGFTEAELIATDVEELLGWNTRSGRPGARAGSPPDVVGYRHADGHALAVRLDAQLVTSDNGQSDLLIAQLEECLPTDAA